METLLTTKDLTKRYGKLTAVDKLNLEIGKGMVFGLLGPNGSGKTTTLGMLLGVTNPTEGSYQWLQSDNSHNARKKIGAILEKPVFYPYMNALQNLEIVCRIKEVPFSKIQSVLEFVGLWDRRGSKFSAYSLGMRQRLAIASALVCDPEVLIMDEPTNGLDPEGIHDIRSLILNISDTGKTLVVASHLLDEIQKVCSDFAVMRSGRMIYQGNVADDLNVQTGVELRGDSIEAIKSVLAQFEHTAKVSETKGGILAKFESNVDTSKLNQHFAERGIYLSHLANQMKTLEEQFLEILKDDNA